MSQRDIWQLCQMQRYIFPWINLLHLQIVRCVGADKGLCNYHRKLSRVTKKGDLDRNHFTRHENMLQYFYLKIMMLGVGVSVEGSLDHGILQKIALMLLTRVHHGQEFIVHDLLSTVLFNNALWRWEKLLIGTYNLFCLFLVLLYALHGISHEYCVVYGLTS